MNSNHKRLATQIQPLSNWVLVALDVEKEVTSEGGIVIPEGVSAVSERTKTGKALAVGPDCSHVFKGDCVVLDSYDQKACEIDDTTVMVREENILATTKAS